MSQVIPKGEEESDPNRKSPGEYGYSYRNGLLLYLRLWAFAAVVVAASGIAYFYAVEYLLQVALVSLDAPANAMETVEGKLIGILLKILGGVLVCWRAAKTFVLLGSPFSLGVTIILPGEGRSVGYIGEFRRYDGADFWFGILSRPNPNSDKVMRSRIEYLQLVIPWPWPSWTRTLTIDEGRWRISSTLTNGTAFRERFYRHFSNREFVDPNQKKRIDGLTWHFRWNEITSIEDDFGKRMMVRQEDGGGFTITDFVSNKPHYLPTVAKLRRLAQGVLEPVREGRP